MIHSEIFSALLITSLALTLVSTLLARWKVPSIVGFILTGMLIGPSGFHWISSLPAAEGLSELGIILLMFSIGLEISLGHLQKMIRPLLTLGFAQVTLSIGFSTFFLATFFDFDLGKSFILGSCLALSSTAVVLKLLNDRRETETPYGRISVVILLFQDIAALPLMAAIPLLSTQVTSAVSAPSPWLTLLWILAFLSSCFLMGRFVVPRFFREVMKTQSREVFFFAIISLTFVIALGAEKVGLSLSLGAFLAGVIISESPYNKQALAEMSPFRDIFLGFFFASVGMMLDFSFVAKNLQTILWLVPIAVALKFSVLYALIRRHRHSHGISFATSLTLTQIGEFSFILAASAFNYKLISNDEFQYFLTLAICSLVSTPLLVHYALKGSAHSDWPELAAAIKTSFKFPFPNTASIKGDQLTSTPMPDLHSSLNSSGLIPRRAIVIGLGHAGQETLLALQNNKIPCVGVDVNHNNVLEVQKLGMEAAYGDCTSPDVLDSLSIKDAFLVIITVSGRHVVPKILATARRLNPKIKILVRVHFLQELSELPQVPDEDVIVSERETAKSIIQKSLQTYGVGS